MMIKVIDNTNNLQDIYCKSSLNHFKIDQHFSLKLSRDITIGVLVLATSKLSLFQLKKNRIEEETLLITQITFQNDWGLYSSKLEMEIYYNKF